MQEYAKLIDHRYISMAYIVFAEGFATRSYLQPPCKALCRSWQESRLDYQPLIWEIRGPE